ERSRSQGEQETAPPPGEKRKNRQPNTGAEEYPAQRHNREQSRRYRHCARGRSQENQKDSQCEIPPAFSINLCEPGSKPASCDIEKVCFSHMHPAFNQSTTTQVAGWHNHRL